MQNYLAVTSNTFQFGAKAELYAGAGPFNLHGWFGFDALFILSPLSFIVELDAGSISVKMTMSWLDCTCMPR